uniref:Uncharacterized protein n=1 Tax=Anguilla anguilla TaxID=7936 RepID=A0A0E9VWI0_ANGAN
MYFTVFFFFFVTSAYVINMASHCTF